RQTGLRVGNRLLAVLEGEPAGGQQQTLLAGCPLLGFAGLATRRGDGSRRRRRRRGLGTRAHGILSGRFRGLLVVPVLAIFLGPVGLTRRLDAVGHFRVLAADQRDILVGHV